MTTDPSPPNPFPRHVRIVQLIFLVLGVVATILLAWWQWERWQSSSGTYQNLGYVIQWPILGICLVVAYRKYIAYERERLLGNEEAAVTTKREGVMTEVPEDFLHDATAASHTAESTDAAASDIFADTRRRDRRRRDTPSPGSAAGSRPPLTDESSEF